MKAYRVFALTYAITVCGLTVYSMYLAYQAACKQCLLHSGACDVAFPFLVPFGVIAWTILFTLLALGVGYLICYPVRLVELLKGKR